MKKPTVVKLTGYDVSAAASLDAFSSSVERLNKPVIIVHGGGTEINDEEKRLGIESPRIDGIRLTSRAALQVVERVLGEINARLVRVLRNAGVNAVGISGVSITSARRMHTDKDSYTGKVEKVDSKILSQILGLGLTPVLSPVCYGGDTNLNVNADQFASAVAVALESPELILISDVAGVLQDGKLIPKLTAIQIADLIQSGKIHSGMVTKVNAALEAINSGVATVLITDMKGFAPGSGTAIVA